MVDRRRAPRFVLTKPIAGHARVLHDVDIVGVAGDELVVISGAPAVPGEDLLIQIGGAFGRIASLEVRPVSCQPVLEGDVIRHQLTLQVVRGTRLLSLWAQET